MKKSIIYLGVALMALNSLNAGATTVADGNLQQIEVDSFKIKTVAIKPEIADEAVIVNPEIFFTPVNSKSVEAQIAADNEITERFVATDLPEFKSKSAEEVISADNQIIEAELPPVQPLFCSVAPAISCTKAIVAR